MFLSLPLLFSPESLSIQAYLTNPPTQRDLFSYVLILAVFYANFYWLIPRLYFHRKYVAFVMIGLLCFVITVFLPEIVIPARKPVHTAPVHTTDPLLYTGPKPPHPWGFSETPPPEWDSFVKSLRPPAPPARPAPPPHRSPFVDISQHIFLFIGMILLALMLKIRARWKQTEKEKLQTELSYLKAQINPHFLFNSLNSIYALAIEKSDKAPAAIVLLSEMMRYVLDDSGKEWVPLDKEISYIRSYIALQQTRFGDSIHLNFQVVDSIPPHLPGNYRIAPLILIPFIENAFKHGVNAEENSDIHISIELKDATLHLVVINHKVKIRPTTEPRSGLGIENTKQRLQLIYPENYMLDIHNNTHDFQVSLILKLI